MPGPPAGHHDLGVRGSNWTARSRRAGTASRHQIRTGRLVPAAVAPWHVHAPRSVRRDDDLSAVSTNYRPNGDGRRRRTYACDTARGYRHPLTDRGWRKWRKHGDEE